MSYHAHHVLTRDQPANFLDGGGGASEANVRSAVSLVLSDPDVKVVLVNCFGGLTKTVRMLPTCRINKVMTSFRN